jgi:hypothetical protein
MDRRLPTLTLRRVLSSLVWIVGLATAIAGGMFTVLFIHSTVTEIRAAILYFPYVAIWLAVCATWIWSGFAVMKLGRHLMRPPFKR